MPWHARQEKAAARRAQAGLGFESAPHTGEKKALTGGARAAESERGEGRRIGPEEGSGPAGLQRRRRRKKKLGRWLGLWAWEGKEKEKEGLGRKKGCRAGLS